MAITCFNPSPFRYLIHVIYKTTNISDSYRLIANYFCTRLNIGYMITRLHAIDYLLIMVLLAAATHIFIKCVMIFRYRQMNFFGKKLMRSFFFYDKNAMKEAFELRIKKYYKLSNTVNSIFYILMSVSMLTYLSVRMLLAFGKVQTLVSQVVANS